jgi:DNA topoisomerase-3
VAKAVEDIKRDKPIILKDCTDKSKIYANKKAASDEKKVSNKDNKAEKKIRVKKEETVKAEGTSEKPKVETYGKCPVCGHPIIEGQRGFGCSNWKNGCKFVIWKEDEFFKSINKKLTKTMVKKLLKDGRIEIKDIGTISYVKSTQDNSFSWKLEKK